MFDDSPSFIKFHHVCFQSHKERKSNLSKFEPETYHYYVLGGPYES